MADILFGVFTVVLEYKVLGEPALPEDFRSQSWIFSKIVAGGL